MARPWRVAGSLLTLRKQIDVRYPNRDRASDGLIGNAEHASRSSDHNPHIVVAGMGVVRAFDCDVNGIPADAYVEELRQLGAAGDPRLNPGGYLIFMRRIAGTHTLWGWHVYTGTNPHTGHAHLSVSTVPSGFDSLAPWPLPMLGGSRVGPTAAIVIPPPPLVGLNPRHRRGR